MGCEWAVFARFFYGFYRVSLRALSFPFRDENPKLKNVTETLEQAPAVKAPEGISSFLVRFLFCTHYVIREESAMRGAR